MSRCISKHGEYSEHELGDGTQRFVCQLCFAFDEDAALARIAELEGAPASPQPEGAPPCCHTPPATEQATP